MSEGLLRDYSRQALGYDRTRAASPSIVEALRAAIEPAPGRSLADIGGGTGNYATALSGLGWDVLVVDRSPEMLTQAEAKGLQTLLASAERLPLDDGGFDAVLMVSMLHHVDDRDAALAEARRILRPGGMLAIKMFTREDVEGLWLNDYFPSSRRWMDETHPRLVEFRSRLPGATATRLQLGDVTDATLAALAGHPKLILERRWRAQTSYFERLERDHPQELRSGLERLAADLEAGRTPQAQAGSATLIVWRKPGE
jgi:demethylmenaquinone methyltransferase/2-methoxy-6-polyprenyl-1,4-benzoquinol methylase